MISRIVHGAVTAILFVIAAITIGTCSALLIAIAVKGT
jgi:hypothetical protein